MKCKVTGQRMPLRTAYLERRLGPRWFLPLPLPSCPWRLVLYRLFDLGLAVRKQHLLFQEWRPGGGPLFWSQQDGWHSEILSDVAVTAV